MRDGVKLVTDDTKQLRAQLEVATSERTVALEGIGAMSREARYQTIETPRTGAEKEPESPAPEREKAAGVGLGL